MSSRRRKRTTTTSSRRLFPPGRRCHAQSRSPGASRGRRRLPCRRRWRTDGWRRPRAGRPPSPASRTRSSDSTTPKTRRKAFNRSSRSGKRGSSDAERGGARVPTRYRRPPMTMSSRESATISVPHRVERADRIPAQRYYDPEFYALERERFWPRVWQMACRLEEIPQPGDFVVYDILDQSVIITRVDASTVKAFHNACRHRGVQLVQDRGSCPDGFTCPFHGWQWKTDGKCRFVYSPSLFEKDQLKGQDLALRECRLETWGGCAFINFDRNAPALRESIEPFATMHDAWHVESLRTEWWLAARLPVNWKLAMEAFMEGYHVMATHP